MFDKVYHKKEVSGDSVNNWWIILRYIYNYLGVFWKVFHPGLPEELG